jgi:hypothetical protein
VLRIRSIALLLLIAQGMTASADPECIGGTIHLRVLTDTGEPSFRARLVLAEKTSGKVIQRTFGSPNEKASPVLVLRDIPCGTYDLTVHAPSLDTASRPSTLTVSNADQWLTLAFPFDKPIDHYQARPSIRLVGTVGASWRGSLAWVRLVGVYSNVSRETSVNDLGRFAFDGVPEGEYLVVLTAPGAKPSVKTVRLLSGSNSVEFLAP